MKHHIYHHNDMDGHASGAVVAYGLQEVEGVNEEDILFYRMNYGQSFDDSQIDFKEDIIYIVDFALQPYKRMDELARIANVVWIDHHLTSYKWLKENYQEDTCNPFARVIIEEGEKAACELCWEAWFDAPVPGIIKRISQYDIWNKGYPDFNWEEEQIPLQMYLYNIETRPSKSMNFWRELFRDARKCKDPDYQGITAMIQEGKILQKFNDKQLRKLTLEHAYEADLKGYKVCALNTTQVGSRQFEVAIDVNDYDMVCAFRLYKGEYWIVSLYSVKDNIDCGALAKILGAEGPYKSGGGHPGAAGFQTSYEHLSKILKPIPKENE